MQTFNFVISESALTFPFEIEKIPVPESEPTNPFRETVEEPVWVAVQNSTSDLDGLYNFLNEYAAPKFFSSVAKNAEGNYVSCIYDGQECARIYVNHSSYGEKELINGQIVYEHNFGQNAIWKQAVICKNAILILYQNDYGIHPRNGLVITKSSSGVPAFLRCIDPEFGSGARNGALYDTNEFFIGRTIYYMIFSAGIGAVGYRTTDRSQSAADVTLETVYDASGDLVPGVYLPHATLSAWAEGGVHVVTDANGAKFLALNCYFLLI